MVKCGYKVTTMNVNTEKFVTDFFPVKSAETARNLAMALRPNHRIRKVEFHRP